MGWLAGDQPRDALLGEDLAHLRFGAQKPPKGRLHQPFSADVGPPSVVGAWRWSGLDPQTPGAEARPTKTGNRVKGEPPPGAMYQGNRRTVFKDVGPPCIVSLWRASGEGTGWIRGRRARRPGRQQRRIGLRAKPHLGRFIKETGEQFSKMSARPRWRASGERAGWIRRRRAMRPGLQQRGIGLWTNPHLRRFINEIGEFSTETQIRPREFGAEKRYCTAKLFALL